MSGGPQGLSAAAQHPAVDSKWLVHSAESRLDSDTCGFTPRFVMAYVGTDTQIFTHTARQNRAHNHRR